MNKKLVSATIGITFVFVLLAVTGLTAGQYVLGAGLYDVPTPLLSFGQGSWATLGPNASYYGDYAIQGNATGGSDALSFQFYGDSFTLYVLKYSAGGDAAVCIDSSFPNCTNINTYNATNLFQQTITFSGLAVGVHSVQIITISNNTILDAIFISAVEPEDLPTSVIQIEVTVEVTAAVVVEMTEEPYVATWDITDSSDNVQTVAFEYKTDIGQLITILTLFGVLLISLIGLIFQVWAHFHNDSD